MRRKILFIVLLFVSIAINAQSVLGKWKAVIKESTPVAVEAILVNNEGGTGSLNILVSGLLPITENVFISIKVDAEAPATWIHKANKLNVKVDSAKAVNKFYTDILGLPEELKDEYMKQMEPEFKNMEKEFSENIFEGFDGVDNTIVELTDTKLELVDEEGTNVVFNRIVE